MVAEEKMGAGVGLQIAITKAVHGRNGRLGNRLAGNPE